MLRNDFKIAYRQYTVKSMANYIIILFPSDTNTKMKTTSHQKVLNIQNELEL